MTHTNDTERAYFQQFAGDRPGRHTCDNCGALFYAERPVHDPHGRTICCAHCVFNPLGCRCKYGEFNVAEDWWDGGEYLLDGSGGDSVVHFPYDDEE